MGRSTASYGQLLNYITKDKAVLKGEDKKPILILHNVQPGTIAELRGQFLENEANRAYKRKSNKLFHDVLSWGAADAENLNSATIEQIAREYFRLRNENALYVGAIHTDKEHIHLHLCISGTESYTGKSIRVTKSEFASIKNHLQTFEIGLGITNSTVEHGKGERDRKSDSEYQLEQRTGKPSRKEEIRQILEQIYGESISKNEFISKVHEQGLETYERGGKTSGVSDNERHMRFSTLGFTEQRFEVLEKRQEWVADLEALRSGEVEKTEPMEEELSDEEKQKTQELNDLREGTEPPDLDETLEQDNVEVA